MKNIKYYKPVYSLLSPTPTHSPALILPYSCPSRLPLSTPLSVAYRGGFGVFTPPPENLKALQIPAKLNPIVKTVKNC